MATGYIFAFISGLNEHKFVESFVNGAADLLGVALTIGLARAVSIVMEESHTSDTIMNFFSQQVSECHHFYLFGLCSWSILY